MNGKTSCIHDLEDLLFWVCLFFQLEMSAAGFQLWLLSGYSAQASNCNGFPCGRAQALGCSTVCTGLAALWYVESPGIPTCNHWQVES